MSPTSFKSLNTKINSQDAYVIMNAVCCNYMYRSFNCVTIDDFFGNNRIEHLNKYAVWEKCRDFNFERYGTYSDNCAGTIFMPLKIMTF